MRQIKDTIPIAFNGGAYGTYLEWLLTTLTTDWPVMAPFATAGNSHGFRGNHLNTMYGWDVYVNAIDPPKEFVRIHPKTREEHSISDNLETILSSVDRCLYIYPDRGSVLLNLNNNFAKVWDDWWTEQFRRDMNPEKIYQNWPVDRSVPIDKIPIWIQREFLSYYLMPAWYDQVDWFHPDVWQHDRCTTIFTNELLDDIKGVLARIQEATGLVWTKPVSDILPIHQKMVSLQNFRSQDQLCSDIVNNTLGSVPFDWADKKLPLPSQCYIQWELRNRGYEMACHGLDLFPTNSVNLKSILYSTKNNEPI